MREREREEDKEGEEVGGGENHIPLQGDAINIYECFTERSEGRRRKEEEKMEEEEKKKKRKGENTFPSTPLTRKKKGH